MKDRRKRIEFLKIEIEKLELEITNAESFGKMHFASRLRLIQERKNNILNSWILNS
jgi:uncharacterized protein YqgQ